MAEKIIAPQRGEELTPSGKPTRRFSYYLEENSKQTNESTELTESDPSSINLSSAQLSQVNKKVAELVNESLVSQAGIIAKLVKRIDQLENIITVNQNNSKKFAQLENDFVAPFYKLKYDKLTIKKATLGDATADNITINELLKLPSTNNASSPTIQFGDGDSGFYEESDDSVALSLGGVKRYGFESTILRTPFGIWNSSGVNLTGITDSYIISNNTVLSLDTLGNSVVNSSLTSLGVLVNAFTSGAYHVDGIQVVSNQGGAISNADGTLASATSQLNGLLLRVRAHGLIAT